MSLDTRLRRLLRAWKSSGVPVEPVDEAAARRDVLVARLGDFIEIAAQRQRRTQRSWALAAAAAAMILLVGVAAIGWKHAQPERAGQSARMGSARNTLAGIVVSGARVEVVRATGATTVSNGAAALGLGDRITRAPGGASISMPSGALAELGAGPRASVIATDEHTLNVAVGMLRIRVAPQPTPNRFTVLTPDARVSVRGTVFDVAVTDDEKPRIKTRVSVSEGVVSVEHAGRTWFVGAGESWPPPPPSPQAPSERVTRKEPANARAHEAPDVPPADESFEARTPSTATASALPEQNRLFAAAMTAKGTGRDGDTVRLLGELLSRYPGSPLAQEARVERFRALSRLGRSDEAAREARRYLAEYPGGFARDEARAVALPQTR